MPIYEYQCRACKHHFEKLQKMSDPALSVCPECQQPELAKLVSAAGFQLKGDGWYVTDFKGDKKKSDAGKGAATEKPASSDS